MEEEKGHWARRRVPREGREKRHKVGDVVGFKCADLRFTVDISRPVWFTDFYRSDISSPE